MTQISRIRLELQKAVSNIAISKNMLFDMTVEVEQDFAYHCAHDLILSLRSFIYTSDTRSIKIPYPASAWEHVKKEYAPEWFKKRYPVKFKSLAVDVREMFPDLTGVSKGARYLDIVKYDTTCFLHE